MRRSPIWEEEVPCKKEDISFFVDLRQGHLPCPTTLLLTNWFLHPFHFMEPANFYLSGCFRSMRLGNLLSWALGFLFIGTRQCLCVLLLASCFETPSYPFN